MLAIPPSNYISSLYSYYSPEEQGHCLPAVPEAQALRGESMVAKRWPAREVPGQGSYRGDLQGWGVPEDSITVPRERKGRRCLCQTQPAPGL